MIKLTIYRLGSTAEIDTDALTGEDLESGKVYKIEYKKELVRFRPYYRLYVDGVLNIYAEEED